MKIFSTPFCRMKKNNLQGSNVGTKSEPAKKTSLDVLQFGENVKTFEQCKVKAVLDWLGVSSIDEMRRCGLFIRFGI